MFSRPALVAATLLALVAPDARALPGAVCFGAGEKLVAVSSTQLRNESGIPLELAVKVTTHCMVFPYAARSDGLVLKAVNQSSVYQALPPADQLARLQRAALIPNPLPPSDLPVFDLVFGHFLWFFLAVAAVALSVVAHRALGELDSSRAARGEKALRYTWLHSMGLGGMGALCIATALAVVHFAYLAFRRFG